jgi:hypothetical protein
MGNNGGKQEGNVNGKIRRYERHPWDSTRIEFLEGDKVLEIDRLDIRIYPFFPKNIDTHTTMTLIPSDYIGNSMDIGGYLAHLV